MAKYLDDKLLEKLLIDKSKKWSIKELKARTVKKFFSQGEHYLSVTWRETAIVANEDGRTWKENLIIKSIPNSEVAKTYLENSGVFKKEITVYLEMLESMEAEINDCENGGELLWPRCIGVEPYSLVILEDLVSKGYRKVDRQEGLDYEHSMLAFKAVAKFHVLSLNLKDKIKSNEEIYLKFPFGTNTPNRYEFFKSKISDISKAMLTWGSKWKYLAEYFMNNTEELFLKHVKKCEVNEENFNVLNHGDLWTSNLLFKHCEFTDKVIGIRFVDYQMTHYSSFALDLQYLLQCSVQPAVRKHHTDDLLAAYHSALIDYARKLNLSNVIIPSLNAIKTEMTDKILVGIILSAYLLDVMLVDSDEAMNLEELLTDGFKFTKTVVSSAIYRERMQAILEPYIDVDLLNI